MEELIFWYFRTFGPIFAMAMLLVSWAKERDTLNRLYRLYGEEPVYTWPELSCNDLYELLRKVMKNGRVIHEREVYRYLVIHAHNFTPQQVEKITACCAHYQLNKNTYL